MIQFNTKLMGFRRCAKTQNFPVEPRNFVSGSNPKLIIADKNKMPKRAFNVYGGW